MVISPELIWILEPGRNCSDSSRRFEDYTICAMNEITSGYMGSTQVQYISKNDSKFNSSTFGTCSFREFDVASLITQIVVAIVILVPNVAVIKVILTNRQRRYQRAAFTFIASLSVADASVAVYVMISVLIGEAGGVKLSPYSWAVMYICGSVPFYSSVLHLLVIAVDRLLYIGYYRKYNAFMTKNVVTVILTICWGLALVPVIPVAFGLGACGNRCQCQDGGLLQCQDFACSSIFVVFTKDMLFGNSFFFFVVMIIITVLYTLLFRKVRAQSIKLTSHSSNLNKATRRIKREFKLARTLALVIFISFAFWGPLMIVYIVDFSLPYKQRLGETFANIITIPNLLNSVSNPIIYAVRMKHMRQEMIPAVCKKRKLRTSSVDTADSTSNDRTLSVARPFPQGGTRCKVTPIFYKSTQLESLPSSPASVTNGLAR